MTRNLLIVTLAIATLASMVVSAAENFPGRPVRMVVPFPPGSASDFLARVLGQKLGETWGQQVVVDNRPGAGGLIGGTVVARSNPDGYTIALIGQPHLTAALLAKDPPWDPFKDFAHIGMVATMPNVVTVGPGLPVTSVAELITQVKAKPGYYNFGSAGIGSSSHLAAEMFNAAAGLKAVHIPFKLIGDIFAEMYGGRLHYYLFPVPAAMPALKDGKLKALAVGGRARAPALPGVPTLTESALPGFTSETYFGLLGPAALPKNLIAQINAVAVKLLRTEDVKNRYLQQGAESTPGTPDEFLKVQRAEFQRVAKIVKEIGIKPQ
ncbi:MAG TPA: tripartite tricarboxylate transporter substrate binding protein [Burkholderiales bacterium]|nr:tripartite tricarboxylate transporter substrate binding protein [Burkholderiales bacterium]